MSKPGPESRITHELVQRVSERIAKGIPLKIALESEDINFEAYRKHIRRHPELKAIQSAAKIKFLEVTYAMITEKPCPMLRWLLERRHSAAFSPDKKNPENPDADSDETDTDTDTESTSQTIAGVPQHLVEEARKNVKTL
jgi:hypothetical protein